MKHYALPWRREGLAQRPLEKKTTTHLNFRLQRSLKNSSNWKDMTFAVARATPTRRLQPRTPLPSNIGRPAGHGSVAGLPTSQELPACSSTRDVISLLAFRGPPVRPLHGAMASQMLQVPLEPAHHSSAAIKLRQGRMLRCPMERRGGAGQGVALETGGGGGCK